VKWYDSHQNTITGPARRQRASPQAAAPAAHPAAPETIDK
jgi:hypothetical protein